MFDMLQIVKHQMLLFVPHMETIIHDTLSTPLGSEDTHIPTKYHSSGSTVEATLNHSRGNL